MRGYLASILLLLLSGMAVALVEGSVRAAPDVSTPADASLPACRSPAAPVTLPFVLRYWPPLPTPTFTPTPTVTPTPLPPTEGIIIYTGVPRPHAKTDVFSIHLDGSNLQNLTRNAASDSKPRVSRDGLTVAFSTNRDFSLGDIYTMRIDGRNPRKVLSGVNFLGEGDYFLFPQAWAPDGSEIAFFAMSYEAGATKRGLWIVDLDGGNLRRVVPTHDEFTWLEADWSPDGSKFAFSLYIV